MNGFTASRSGGMSAVTSNSGDRELEALRRAQRAHEPSMEEILASIRNIIAEERDPARSAALREAPPRPAAASPGPQIVRSRDAPETQQAAPGSPRNSEAGRAPDADLPQVLAWRQPDPVKPPPLEEQGTRKDEPLLSPETGAAVSSAFATLSATLAARSGEIADGMAREMLRPMLKAWIDENLPGIVERLVGAEIERLAREAR
jgi:cell pole-organizing protein PopZ